MQAVVGKGKQMARHIHILGICGTFMGSLALIARQLGFKVTGCDQGVYPPMSDQLTQAGIALIEGFAADQADIGADDWVVGNVVSRGNPLMEHLLDTQQPLISGPAWLAQHLLKDKWVLAVSGTHGKTTTASMLAWILEHAGLNPGFLIGGVPQNFGVSARVTDSPFFVIEADEYDSAFFDKRSKFIHYCPQTLVINNLEFDHADIFEDLAAIQRQFSHLLRSMPSSSLVIHPSADSNITELLAQGCWSSTVGFGFADQTQPADFTAREKCPDGSEFEITCQDAPEAMTPNPTLLSHFGLQPTQQKLAGSYDGCWDLLGRQSVSNALAAVLAAAHAGVAIPKALEALSQFKSVKRRLELLGEVAGVRFFDDFAHHPTAIEVTLKAMSQHMQQTKIAGRLIAVLDPCSNTMKMGVHKHTLAAAVESADLVFWYQSPQLQWQVAEHVAEQDRVVEQLDALVEQVVSVLQPEDQVVIMSNGGFGGFHQKLLAAARDC